MIINKHGLEASMYFKTQRGRTTTLFLLVILPVLLVILVAGFGTRLQPKQAPQLTPQQNESTGKRVVMIIHSNLKISTFWPVVIRGAEQAAKDANLILEYHDLEKISDYAEMSRLIEDAVASKPDGMIISLPDAKALKPAVQKIVDANIPFVVVNAGMDDAKDMGALTYVGQLEYDAGYAAGVRMVEAGVQHAYCINLTPNLPNVNQRCQGFTDAIQETGGTVEVLVADKKDLVQAKERIMMALEGSPETDGLLSTADLPITIDAIEEANLDHEVKFASFDFSPASLEAIQNGKMMFAIDQQPYMQGYLPVVTLNLYFSNANTMYKTIPTGPDFITLENVERIKELAKAGTR
jgi:simple sugar transport system substrate-binding protein